MRHWLACCMGACPVGGRTVVYTRRHSDGFAEHAEGYSEQNALYNIERLEKDVRHRVFLTLLRMSTNQESKSNWMKPGDYRKLIYDSWSIDVPMLFDVCVIFGPSNLEGTRKMICDIIKLQPSYRTDISQGFKLILDTITDSMNRYIIPKPGAEFSVNNILASIKYLQDALVNLWAMVHVFPTIAEDYERALL